MRGQRQRDIIRNEIQFKCAERNKIFTIMVENKYLNKI
jgi:hypothetical protein